MSVTIIIKWNAKEFTLNLGEAETVAHLKAKLFELTEVPPENQKILNLKSEGKPARDENLVSTLDLKVKKFMMVGSAVKLAEKRPAPEEEEFEVVDDLEYDYTQVSVMEREENIAKLNNRINNLHVDILNPPRPGKKLLVLDVDYTLFDHRSSVETPLELMRPYLHDFLKSSYANYDIIIWSATSLKWIEVKMKELGVSTNPNYKLVAMLDHSAMITVVTESHGVHDTKPLGVIWGKFSDIYSSKNTIMFDDLGRNFVMNPQNGLRIRPFKKAPLNRDSDTELLKLAEYLDMIAELEDLSVLNHQHWESYVKKQRKKK